MGSEISAPTEIVSINLAYARNIFPITIACQERSRIFGSGHHATGKATPPYLDTVETAQRGRPGR